MNSKQSHLRDFRDRQRFLLLPRHIRSSRVGFPVELHYRLLFHCPYSLEVGSQHYHFLYPYPPPTQFVGFLEIGYVLENKNEHRHDGNHLVICCYGICYQPVVPVVDNFWKKCQSQQDRWTPVDREVSPTFQRYYRWLWKKSKERVLWLSAALVGRDSSTLIFPKIPFLHQWPQYQELHPMFLYCPRRAPQNQDQLLRHK